MTKTRLVSIATLLLTATAAHSAPVFTSLGTDTSGAGQAALIASIYGGAWSRLTGTESFTNGPLTATRAADGGLSSPLDIRTSSPSTTEDTAWSGGGVQITARVRSSTAAHLFGWLDGTSGLTAFQPLVTTSLDTTATAPVSGSFRWALKDTGSGQLFTSSPGDNPGNRDQMVTYAITGTTISTPTWLLVWEDRTSNAHRDFNDIAIEITSTPAPLPVSIPAPGSVALAAIWMLVSRRRRSPVLQ